MYDEFINERVMHRITKRTGRINDITGDKMIVSFGDARQIFPFPSALQDVLELEHEDLLTDDIIKDIAISAFEKFQNIYTIALNNEIRYLRLTGGKHYRAFDGELVDQRNHSYIYAFETDTEMNFPEGTVIKIIMTESRISAYVMSCEDFVIMFQCEEQLTEGLGSIEFTADSWFLLEALIDRIHGINPWTDSIASELASRGVYQINRQATITLGQNAALRKSSSEPITFVWGPPGTGKTYTLSRIALEAMGAGKRVLMVSYSNVSVDGALLRVAEICDHPEGMVTRYGYPRAKELLDSNRLVSYQYVLNKNVDLAQKYEKLKKERSELPKKDIRQIELKKKMNAIRAELHDKEVNFISNAAFVATTVSKAVADAAIYSQKFDVVIFDEASMAYVPQVVFAGSLAKEHFICLGDFSQLPAIVQNKEDDRLTKDIFEYTGITSAVENGYGHNWLVMLNVQYRMHPDIAKFVSNRMYAGLLKSAPDMEAKRQEIADCNPVETEPMGLIDLSGYYSVCTKTSDGSRVNILSALISIRLAEILSRKYEVGLITPYSAQSRLMLSMIRDLQDRSKQFRKVTTATVHQFQGSEKAIIIYDAVDCFRMQYPGVLLTSLKHNTADRLFNVALTRAQGKFLLLANRDFFVRKNISKKLLFTKLLTELYQKSHDISDESIVQNIDTGSKIKSYFRIGYRENVWRTYIEDIRNAKKKISIEIPGFLDEDEDYLEELAAALEEARNREVIVKIKYDENISIPYELEDFEPIAGYAATPLTLIDKHIIWFGEPLCAADFITEGDILPTETSISIRFVGSHTGRSIEALMGI